MKKICTRCKEEKDLELFNRVAKAKYGRCEICKKCRSIQRKEIRIRDKEKISIQKKASYQRCKEHVRQHGIEYREKNKDSIKEKKAIWYKKNRESVLERVLLRAKGKKVEISEYQKQYREINRDILNEKRADYQRERAKTDIQFRLSRYLRTGLYLAIQRQTGERKKPEQGSGVRDLGCTLEEFKVYIAKKFKDDMSWDNYGEWHLDHIRPVSRFDLLDPAQRKEAFHYSNYQPLWANENLAKSDNWSAESEEKWQMRDRNL